MNKREEYHQLPNEGDKCACCGAEWCKNPHGEIAILHLPPCPGGYRAIPLQPQT